MRVLGFGDIFAALGLLCLLNVQLYLIKSSHLSGACAEDTVLLGWLWGREAIHPHPAELDRAARGSGRRPLC